MSVNRRSGFTLIEILIVVVIMAVLAATIIPQFTDSTGDARESTAVFNLNTMRAQIELYKAQHGGDVPTSLANLAVQTNVAGTTSAGDGVVNLGPYMQSVPENTVNATADVKVISAGAAVVGDVTASEAGGWIYSTDSGGVWLDHSTLYAK